MNWLTESSSRLLRSRVGLAAIALAGAAALLPALRGTAQEAPQGTPAKPALTVTTVRPQSAEWPRRVAASGSISAWQEAIVGSEIAGLRLAELRVDVGDRVRRGQELARLQSDTVVAEREQTQAALAEAEASLAEARANAERARRIESSGALSAVQVSQYLTAELTAAARVEALKARLKSDTLRLAQTRILAPDNGTVIARAATLGAVVQTGQELFRLIRRDRLEWRAELPAAELARIRPGMPVRLSVAGQGEIRGRVRLVAPTLDAQTRNGLVYVDLDARSGAAAGMFASGEIEIGRNKLLTLPQSAVLLRDGYSYAFRLGEDMRVTQIKVGVGQRAGDRVAITEGLASDATVVATGVGFLADGDLVRLAPMGNDKTEKR